MNTKAMTCEQYVQDLNGRFFFDAPLDEMINDGHFEAISLFNLVKHQAEVDSVVLLDVEDWDYEQYFDGIYSARESLQRS